MKKNYFLGMATLGLLTLAACSSDEDPIIDNPTASGTQEIVLQVVNSGDGLTTRAGRPLNSSAAGQTIENVKVIIVNDENKIVKVKEYSNWVSGDASTYANGYQTTLTLKGNEKLNADTYTGHDLQPDLLRTACGWVVDNRIFVAATSRQCKQP